LKLFFLIILVFMLGQTYAQVNCLDFIVSGTANSTYLPPAAGQCGIYPLPAGSIPWTSSASTGSIQFSYAVPKLTSEVCLTAIDQNDLGKVSVDGGGALTLSSGSCVLYSQDTIGPYSAIGYGDAKVTVSSTLPFSTLTITNIGGNTGFVWGGCNCDSIGPVAASELPEEIIMPNIFTPDGNANNVLFGPEEGVSLEFELDVFNRWGSKVFSTRNSVRWDGRSISGAELPAGIYYWAVRFKGESVEYPQQSGLVHLVR
jgi:gliding motility-associated-like protein